MCVLAYAKPGETGIFDIEYTSHPYGENISQIGELLEESGCLIGFNLKYELNWLRRYGLQYRKRLWCCQVFEFLYSGQFPAYPSLEDTCRKYELGEKHTDIESLWAQGVDTPNVPWDILRDRVSSDVRLTKALYELQLIQYQKMSRDWQNLFRLEMMDLPALAEMEWNGQLYDVEQSQQLSEDTKKKIADLSARLNKLCPYGPINWNSTYHRSAVLYGGVISWQEYKEDGVFKTGTKAGQPKLRKVNVDYTFPRLVDPLPNSELEEEGYWSTDEGTIRQLKTSKKAKEIIECLLLRQELEKLNSTYYDGLVGRIQEMEWADAIIHGQFNQVVAVTGRLSSSRPNLQNQLEESKKLFVSRYDRTSGL